MNKKEIPSDSKWNDLYVGKPEDGQKCMSKVRGAEGYINTGVFVNGYFETYINHINRFEITRWKHDLWLPVN